MKLGKLLCCLLIVIVLLSACTAAPATQSLPTLPDSPTPGTQILPSQVPSGTPTLSVAETALIPSPAITPLPFIELDGLRMAYIIGGNLYFQDGSKSPIQLTDGGEDSSPIFSDDGKKIVFFRGFIPRSLFVINPDGSGEQALITSSLLTVLNLGYSDNTEPRSVAFVPGTHLIVFNTHELDSRAKEAKDPQTSLQYRYSSVPNQDLLLVDTETAGIKMLLPSGKGGPFQVSLDGKLIGIQTVDHIDVVNLDGKIIHRNLVSYPTAWLYIWTPDIYWTQDSNKLNVVSPIPTASVLSYTGPDPQKIWQYSMDNSLPSEIPFSPPPMNDWLSFSPDGNWVVYSFGDYAQKRNETKPMGIYIGNLRNGDSHLLKLPQQIELPQAFYWSPDSAHFIFEDELQLKLFIGDINGNITITDGGMFLGWVDESRYLYGNLLMGEIGKEEKVKIASGLFAFDNSHPFTFVFIKDAISP